MEYPRDNAFTFLFSTYKKTAGVAFAALLIIAIPLTLALLNQQQDVRQRASELSLITVAGSQMCQLKPPCIGASPACTVLTPAEGWCTNVSPSSISGAYKWLGHCTVGCEGNVEHLLYVTMQNNSSGVFMGSGYYPADTRVTWDFRGKQNLTEKTFIYEMRYTGLNAGYIATGSGTIKTDGSLEGNLSTSYNQKGTFVASPTSCYQLPLNCSIVTSTGTPNCQTGIIPPAKTASTPWCPRIKDIPVTTSSSSSTIATGAAAFDLNDDGKLNIIDQNILYSNFSKRQGD